MRGWESKIQNKLPEHFDNQSWDSRGGKFDGRLRVTGCHKSKPFGLVTCTVVRSALYWFLLALGRTKIFPQCVLDIAEVFNDRHFRETFLVMPFGLFWWYLHVCVHTRVSKRVAEISGRFPLPCRTCCIPQTNEPHKGSSVWLSLCDVDYDDCQSIAVLQTSFLKYSCTNSEHSCYHLATHPFVCSCQHSHCHLKYNTHNTES